jgi:hypothetical protein
MSGTSLASSAQPLSSAPSGSGTTRATTTTSQTASSSSATPTPTADNTPRYVITSKRGTKLDDFKQFAKDLDGGEGKLWFWELIGKQMYLANINASIAETLKEEHKFIATVHLPVMDTEDELRQEEFRATNRSQRTDTLHDGLLSKKQTRQASKSSPRAILGPNSNAPWWKKMLSAPPRTITEANGTPRNDPDYREDDTGGRGTTIYVLDDGFDTDIPVRRSSHFPE